MKLKVNNRKVIKMSDQILEMSIFEIQENFTSRSLCMCYKTYRLKDVRDLIRCLKIRDTHREKRRHRIVKRLLEAISKEDLEKYL